jgi:hypothetical protein
MLFSSYVFVLGFLPVAFLAFRLLDRRGKPRVAARLARADCTTFQPCLTVQASCQADVYTLLFACY